MAEAFLFLAEGAVDRFSGRRWPLPSAGTPGAWVERGPVRALRPLHLAQWLGPELWRVELGGTVEERELEVEAQRGRLVGRVDAWGPAVRILWAERCTRQVRAQAVAGLERLGHRAVAEELGAATTAQEIRALSARPLGRAAEELLGYAADCLACARADDLGAVGLIAAACAVASAGDAAAALSERAAQSDWLARRLGLCGPPAA